ncbi:hypothetical protein DM860_014735 [Cuscuta australis]|uniref:DUF1421 domain-containing protein n=1 Tax=Cuscuta australis TaxID=267555 RepID=A0A328DHJ3_9ASTE|nr:hypothetical protein DM860_014735 [Cuscuta australis]
METGSAGLATTSVSKGFDFASGDILCSDEDYANRERSTRSHSDPAIGSNSEKEFHKNKMTRSSMLPTLAYHPPQGSLSQDAIDAVEMSVKKHTDNLMRFLEGISSRLSQLELYCYNLEKSVTEIHSDLVHDHEDADSKLKSFEKHLHEVHRSVEILIEKQELVESQDEQAKLQFARKESATVTKSSSQQHEERTPRQHSSCDAKQNNNNSLDFNGEQLLLAPPHQYQVPITQIQHIPPRISPQAISPHSQGYYLTPPSPPNQQLLQLAQGQYMPTTDSHSQKHTIMPPHPSLQTQSNQTSHAQSAPPYQQQLLPHQKHIPYPPSQPTPSPEIVPYNIPFSGSPQTSHNHPEGMLYGSRPGQQLHAPANQHLEPAFGGPGEGYGISHVMYEGGGEGEGRGHRPPQQSHHAFQQGSYLPPQLPSGNANVMVRHPRQMTHNFLHKELVEKVVSMGYMADQVINAIQRLEGSGQAVDFNVVLDQLNGPSSGGGSHKLW